MLLLLSVAIGFLKFTFIQWACFLFLCICKPQYELEEEYNLVGKEMYFLCSKLVAAWGEAQALRSALEEERDREKYKEGPM